MVGLPCSLAENGSGLLGDPGGNLTLRVRGGQHDGHLVALRAAKCTIGSGPTCTLRLRGFGFHPLHCLILRGAQGTLVRRLADDTRLNDHPFTEAALTAGDRLTVGPVQFEVIAVPHEQHGQPSRTKTRPGSKARSRLVRQRRLWAAEHRRLKRRATQYRNHIAELRHAQNRAVCQLEDNADQIRRLRQALDQLRRQLASHQQMSQRDRAAWEAHRVRLEQEADTRQSQLAEQHRLAELEARQTREELIQLSAHHVQLQGQLQQAEQACCQAEEDRQAADQELANLQALFLEAQARQADLEARIEREQAAWDAQRRALEEDSANWQAELAQSQDNTRTASTELHGEILQLRGQQGQLQQELDELTHALHEAQTAQATAEQCREQAEAERLVAEDQLTTLQSLAVQLQEQLAERERRAERDDKAWEAERLRLEEEAARWQRQLAEQRQSATPADAVQRELEELRGQYTRLQQQLDLSERTHQELKTARATAEQALASLEQTLQAVQDERAELASERDAVQLEAAELRTQVETMQCELEERGRHQDQLESKARQAQQQGDQWRAEVESLRHRMEQLAVAPRSEPPPETAAPAPSSEHKPAGSSEERLTDQADEIRYQRVAEEAPVNSREILHRFGGTLGPEEDEDINTISSEAYCAALAPDSPQSEANFDGPRGEDPGFSEEDLESAETPLPAEPADDEESIEDYMSRLLQRVRGETHTPRPHANHALPIDPMLQSIPRKSEPPRLVEPVTVSERPVREYVQRVAPEKTMEMSAMRELAVSSARFAIDSSRQRRQVNTAIGKLVVTLFALATGLVMLWAYDGSMKLVFYGAAASFVISICWALQTLYMTRHLLRMRREKRRAGQAAVQATAAEVKRGEPSA